MVIHVFVHVYTTYTFYPQIKIKGVQIKIKVLQIKIKGLQIKMSPYFNFMSRDFHLESSYFNLRVKRCRSGIVRPSPPCRPSPLPETSVAGTADVIRNSLGRSRTANQRRARRGRGWLTGSLTSHSAGGACKLLSGHVLEFPALYHRIGYAIATTAVRDCPAWLAVSYCPALADLGTYHIEVLVKLSYLE